MEGIPSYDVCYTALDQFEKAGVFQADRPYCCIIRIENSNFPNGHWLSLFFDPILSKSCAVYDCTGENDKELEQIMDVCEKKIDELDLPYEMKYKYNKVAY